MTELHLKDETGLYNVSDADVVVTKYEIGDYCGGGDALVWRNGQVEYWCLSHCSCYGPFDERPVSTMTLEKFKEINGTVTAEWSDDLAAAFLGSI